MKLPPKLQNPVPPKAIPVQCAVKIAHIVVPLMPMDQPFVEGERYKEAGATEWPRRLDLYRADPAGPWVRRHGVLLKAPET